MGFHYIKNLHIGGFLATSGGKFQIATRTYRRKSLKTSTPVIVLLLETEPQVIVHIRQQIRKGKNAGAVQIGFGRVGTGFKIRKKGVAAVFYYKISGLVAADINPSAGVGKCAHYWSVRYKLGRKLNGIE
jgi:hypothetical protein